MQPNKAHFFPQGLQGKALPSMRSGAVDAKAEVWVDKPAPRNRPQRLRLGRQPFPFWVGAEQKGSASNPAIAPTPLPETEPPTGFPFARFQHGGPPTRGHLVQVALNSVLLAR